WRRRLLASRRAPHPLLPPVEALAGRGSLALIRYPDGMPPPLYAASAPPLFDAVGGVVLTLIPHASGVAASAAGSGPAATAAGPRAVLELLVDELARGWRPHAARRLRRPASGAPRRGARGPRQALRLVPRAPPRHGVPRRAGGLRPRRARVGRAHVRRAARQ